MPQRKFRKTKTTKEVTADDLCKLFFERDILLDKLARRNDDILGLGAALADASSDSSEEESEGR